MNLRELDALVTAKRRRVDEVLESHLAKGALPLYASFDVRVHEGKGAAIDANAFPGGFNNLGPESRKAAVKAFEGSIRERGWRKAHLLAEGHTRNPSYQENIEVLTRLLRDAGLRAESSAEAQCAPAVILNRDLAEGVPHAILECEEVVPPIGMGWHVRRKSGHSQELDAVVADLAAQVGFDPWLLRAEWASVDGVSFAGRKGLDRVAAAVDDVAERGRGAAQSHGSVGPERVFVKADPGTYGMGIMAFADGAELLAVNSRGRAKMERGKGGLRTERVLVQEGVPSAIQAGGTAESCVYVVAGHNVGGFLRAHPSRGSFDNLNTPGATFTPFGRQGPGELPSHLRRVQDLVVACAHAALARETRAAMQAPSPRR